MSRPYRRPDVFTAIANPTRRAMLKRLRGAEMTVAELARPLRISMPAVSQHLRVLREVKLVRSRRVGRQRVYQFNDRPLRPLAQWLNGQLDSSAAWPKAH